MFCILPVFFVSYLGLKCPSVSQYVLVYEGHLSMFNHSTAVYGRRSTLQSADDQQISTHSQLK